MAVAVASGAPDPHIVALPTTVLISLGPGGWTTMETVPQLGEMLRLDQIAALYELIDEAERGQVDPAAGLVRMRAIRDGSSRPSP